jgi:HK97 family phage portal protein
LAITDFLLNLFKRKEKRDFLSAMASISRSSGAGVSVDKNTALTFTAVWSAVRLLSESISILPVNVYDRKENGDKVIASSNPVYNLVHSEPNYYMSSVAFFEKCMMDLCLAGNSYIQIVRNRRGIPEALVPFNANDVIVKINDGKVFYHVQEKDEVFDDLEILHFKGVSQNGIIGLSPITQNANAIGWGMALEEYGSKYFTNSAKLSGVLETDRALSESAIERLRNSFSDTYTQLKNSQSTAILEEGLTFKPITISPEQSQFLASRIFSITEIARMFNIPTFMLQEHSKSSFNNIESLSQSYVTYTLMPYIRRMEAEMNRKLFKTNEKGKLFVEFNVNGLLRGNIKDRTDAYKTGLNNGYMTINEVRRKENMNSIPDGDAHYMPLNMTTIDKLGDAS